MVENALTWSICVIVFFLKKGNWANGFLPYFPTLFAYNVERSQTKADLFQRLNLTYLLHM